MPNENNALHFARALADAPNWFWFDGAAAPSGERRTSYLGKGDEVLIAQPGREQEFLDTLRSRQVPSRAVNGAPHEFRSGWVVAFSYEFGVNLMGASPDTSLAPHAGGPLAIAMRVNSVRSLDSRDAGVDPPSAAGRHRSPVPYSWRSSEKEYEQQVEACKAAIHRGDAYVLCLTDTAESTVEGPYRPLSLYERLRASSHATRGGIIVAGGDALVSASPERFLSVRGSTVSTHPIKGTRPRGETPESDRALATDLANDEKERAENLMIVDLMRNDLSRVCEVGSVRVDRFLDVETHARVHQLVSTVSGELAPGRDVFDALVACFPGGSMTGAPKLSAVTILSELEQGPRGLYSGCFGWIDDSGDAELAMTIRGVQLRSLSDRNFAGNVHALVGAGGGITADSVAQREREERDLKAAAVLAAI
ncbi:anthranilate synthase component I family protein [Leucobacter denitrificans]|uniref:Anthranilate synthase component I family protein n=1 Tax=Leucobacter denitrificans TaxID=683042 RepID=A0A7G9S5F8_9MICO|nr:anthranilate synthase component I family protein [Leucobacter denitrificans]QNN63083.1 anthranilate synthase component I family protein [Leucobacter denitrificans]